MKKLSEENRAKIKEVFSRVGTISGTAAESGFTYRMVKRAVNNEPDVVYRKTYAQEDLEALRKAFMEYRSYNKAARATGMCVSTASRLLRSMGLVNDVLTNPVRIVKLTCMPKANARTRIISLAAVTLRAAGINVDSDLIAEVRPVRQGVIELVIRSMPLVSVTGGQGQNQQQAVAASSSTGQGPETTQTPNSV